MALTKTIENDNITVVRKWNVQVRTATVIKEDGTELSRSFHRKTLVPGIVDASKNLVEADISGEADDVKAICNAAWTAQVKSDYKDFLIANNTATG